MKPLRDRIAQLRAEKESLEGRIKEYRLRGLVGTPQKLTDDLWAVNAALSFEKEKSQ